MLGSIFVESFDPEVWNADKACNFSACWTWTGRSWKLSGTLARCPNINAAVQDDMIGQHGWRPPCSRIEAKADSGLSSRHGPSAKCALGHDVRLPALTRAGSGVICPPGNFEPCRQHWSGRTASAACRRSLSYPQQSLRSCLLFSQASGASNTYIGWPNNVYWGLGEQLDLGLGKLVSLWASLFHLS